MAPTLHSPLVNVPIQALPIAAAAVDRDSVIVAANRQFDWLCGREQPTHLGQRLQDVVAEPDRPAVEEALSVLTLLEDRGLHRSSVKALRASAPSLWLEIDIARLGPESVVPYVACLQAIPRRRRLDSPPNRQLEARCERSQNAGSDCVASSVTREVAPWPPLLTTLSHEFRGPLAAILGWAQMAVNGVLPPEAMSRAFTVIGRNAATLSGMIENLFDLSRRNAGSLVLTRQVLDLNPLAHLVVESTLPAAMCRNLVLTERLGNATILVNGDPLRLEQVVRNIVQNAIKFTPDGGHVHVHTRRDGSFAELVVTDNGLGIAPDLLPVIFEPFRHEDATVRPSDRGLGLGLALVRELVTLHDGDVRALSDGRGHGSTFIIRLPLASTAAAA